MAVLSIRLHGGTLVLARGRLGKMEFREYTVGFGTAKIVAGLWVLS